MKRLGHIKDDDSNYRNSSTQRKKYSFKSIHLRTTSNNSILENRDTDDSTRRGSNESVDQPKAETRPSSRKSTNSFIELKGKTLNCSTSLAQWSTESNNGLSGIPGVTHVFSTRNLKSQLKKFSKNINNNSVSAEKSRPEAFRKSYIARMEEEKPNQRRTAAQRRQGSVLREISLNVSSGFNARNKLRKSYKSIQPTALKSRGSPKMGAMVVNAHL